MRGDVDARDQGLYRLRSLTRAAVVGGLTAVGLLTAVVAHAVPGRAHQTSPAKPGAGDSSHQDGSATAVPGNSSLQPPEQPPTPSYSPPAAVSGGT